MFILHMKKEITNIIIIVCIIGCLCSCGKNNRTTENTEGAEEPVSIELFAMDTYMTLTAYGDNAKEALEDAVENIKRIDDLLSTSKESSEISRLNKEKKLAVSPETYGLISRSGEFCESTQGVFDISVYPIMRAWGFTDQNYRVPSGKELKDLLNHVHSDKILCGDDGKTVTLQDPEMEIDLGGIAKGYASDMVMDILRDHEVEHAIINLGGNVKTLGSKPDGSDWKVGIVDPDDDSAYVGGVRIKDKAAITSGGYQRYFEENGKTYIHIIDLSTGYPADTGLSSVTIIAEDGTMADALSTSLFIMGRERAAAYWRDHADLFDVVFVENDGSVWITKGLKDCYFSEKEYNVIK